MTPTFPSLGLPVEETFPALKKALTDQTTAILEAPPGAGKTTLIPLALLNEPWLKGQKIIMLEPRRLAARMAAQRMASLLDEKLGETVGYRIAQDRKTGPKTRIEVVTEGILTRQLQNDPELKDIGLVIFDEFHERNLQGDLGLAFCLEAQTALRDDLRLLIMSATLDGAHISKCLGDTPYINSKGRAFSVETKHLAKPDKFSLAQGMAKAVTTALQEETGNILCFLPGESEIRKTQNLLKSQYGSDDTIKIAPLYGALAPKLQDEALQPTPKHIRKIVLATNLAETSLTIEGIRIVIDGGLKRVARFDGQRGMTKLETVRVSKASAIQRMGRAGRMEEGVCYQLWPKAETQALQDHDKPEILEADLTSFVLELSHWGVSDPSDLTWLDLPPETQFRQAQELLISLGALGDNLRITTHGKDMLRLGLHPRIAHMVLCARDKSEAQAALACDIAATLHDGPLLKGRGQSDLRDSVSLLQNGPKTQEAALNKAAYYKAKDTTKSLKKKLKISNNQSASAQETGHLLSFAYPDRIAQRRHEKSNQYLLSKGMGATLQEHDALNVEPYLVIAHMDAGREQGRIYTAAPLNLADIEEEFSDQIIESDDVGWDKRTQSAKAQRIQKFGALRLKTMRITQINPELLKTALCKGIADTGLHVLPWNKDTETFRKRVQFLRLSDEAWPNLNEDNLIKTLEVWLSPFLNDCTRLDHLKKIDLMSALMARLSWEKQQKLNQLAPTHYRVPSGSSIRLDYSTPEKPVLSVKLQEMFGDGANPTINKGQTVLQIHLLSPAGRPLQVTEDLNSFWLSSYDSVKKEMKGRYPKHPWPDNPTESIATRKTKRKMP